MPAQIGWLHGEELLHNRVAAAEISYEKGEMALFGFRPQFRARPHNTFESLFNVIHHAAAEPKVGSAGESRSAETLIRTLRLERSDSSRARRDGET